MVRLLLTTILILAGFTGMAAWKCLSTRCCKKIFITFASSVALGGLPYAGAAINDVAKQGIVTSFSLADAEAEGLVKTTTSMSFEEFVPYLRGGNVQRVVFRGISPTYLTAYNKDGTSLLVEEGFPSFDDPLSPSGPTQAIALVQHTPGVVVEQDLSDLFKKSKTAKKYGGPKPMLQSVYPK